MSIDLTGVVLTYADLRSADLGGANLKDAFLNKAVRSQAKGTSEEIQKENVRERFGKPRENHQGEILNIHRRFIGLWQSTRCANGWCASLRKAQ